MFLLFGLLVYLLLCVFSFRIGEWIKINSWNYSLYTRAVMAGFFMWSLFYSIFLIDMVVLSHSGRLVSSFYMRCKASKLFIFIKWIWSFGYFSSRVFLFKDGFLIIFGRFSLIYSSYSLSSLFSFSGSVSPFSILFFFVIICCVCF